MSRLKSRLTALRQSGRKALIPYITAGDPHPAETVRLMHTLVTGGADVIELGIPFSDPMADGPVIQLACERALAHGTSLAQVMEMVAEFRATDQETPVVLMGYLNPIEWMGLERFAERAAGAGVDGVLIVDMTIEEAPDMLPAVRKALAPTSPESRIKAVAEQASGYLYYVSLKGVTGAANLDVASVAQKVGEIRRHTDLPIAVGFGIRDAESAARVGAVADGVVVGSALVSEIERLGMQTELLEASLQQRLSAMRQALDRG